MAQICVPVCVARAHELSDAVELASAMADVIELRLDCLAQHELSNAITHLREIIASGRRQIIVTLRAAEEGGHRPISLADRLLFRLQTSNTGADFWDIEQDLALLLQQRETEGSDVSMDACDWQRTICSYHDFVGVPSNLEAIYESMIVTNARIIKVAINADDATDCIPIFRLLERARRDRRELIAIAMGQAGIMTRILGPSRGSFLTYGSLDSVSATAPGQLTARDLRDVYRIDSIDRETEIFGIIGDPVGHSFSPRIHNAAFAAAHLNAVYIPFEVRDANEFMRRMVQPESREIDWNLRGLSVTSPHKMAVMNRLDWIEPSAREMSAVNTIVVRDHELHGYNTDAIGFIQPLQARLGSLKGARCAVLGAGGAARAVLWGLRNEGADVILFVRDTARAECIAAQFGAECESLVGARLGGFDVVVNATPLGTLGKHQNETPAFADQLVGVRLAYDLVYNPTETRFLIEAREAGCETLGGVEMLLSQAVEQFKLWTGAEPNSDVMREAVTRALTPSD